MFTRAFLLATLERAVKTLAQTLAALLVADGTDLLTTDWGGRLSVAGMAAVVSALTSVASGAVGPAGPSVGGEVIEDHVEAVTDPTSPTGASAGDASTVPTGEPVEVVPTVPGSTLPADPDPLPYETVTYDGHGAPIIDGEAP